MTTLSPKLLDIFDALAPFGEIGTCLCAAAGEGAFESPTELRAICTRLGLPQARAGEVERALLAGLRVGIFRKISALNWQTDNAEVAREAAPLLHGASLYRSRVHQDDNSAQVVLTTPPAPSQMATQLESMLAGSWGLRDTRELLPSIAESALSSFSIMTPYMDEVGADIVLNLFDRTKAPEKFLILRTGSDGNPPPGLLGIRSQLEAKNVKILNYRIDRPDSAGNETFHAKVVLADAVEAYVGSLNMHKWSFEYSLEMGFFVRGKAAARVADVLRAIRAVSCPMPP